MQTAFPVDTYGFRVNGTDQAKTIDATSGGVALAPYSAPVTHVLITITAASAATAMFTLDGSAPTTTNGHPLPSTYMAIWPVDWANAAKFIRGASTDLTAHVTPLTKSGA